MAATQAPRPQDGAVPVHRLSMPELQARLRAAQLSDEVCLDGYVWGGCPYRLRGLDGC
jgi:hypothetical protein